MKVEAVVLKPMWAGDRKQGIKFAWPNVPHWKDVPCTHIYIIHSAIIKIFVIG